MVALVCLYIFIHSIHHSWLYYIYSMFSYVQIESTIKYASLQVTANQLTSKALAVITSPSETTFLGGLQHNNDNLEFEHLLGHRRC